MPNLLADATSPYLRQHKDNPVDWMPWGDEAFERARAEGKPVFLSVGYSSCHWCHVMAHESFEDPLVALKMNEGFVNVKVDREERPDVDEAYMAFVQMAVGRGGWPMSVFLTPDRKPFYGGTYWPKDDRGGHPGFHRVLDSLSGAWRDRRKEVEDEANRLGIELEKYFSAGSPPSEGALTPELYVAALKDQAESFDAKLGGFGAAPKFPPHTALELLLAHALSDFAAPEERQAALAMAFGTLDAMCMGGIHDHVGGGFHRYSTDAEWLLPHFEKMLYDNALMLGNLARATAIAAEVDPIRAETYARAAGGIVAWAAREMTSPEGLFYSALDADSLDAHGHSEEGAFYVWAYDDLPPAFAAAFGVREEGNFRDEATGVATGANILHLKEDVGASFDAELDALLAQRGTRPRPGLDDKCIVGWNGLMIGALAEAGLAEPAQRAADAMLEMIGFHGGIPHTVVNRVPQDDAFLDDVAALADGFFKLGQLVHPTDSGELYTGYAFDFGKGMIRDFEDPATGAFFSTSHAHETLFGRTRPAFDQPVPSANALALRVLVAMGDEVRARRLVAALLGTMERVPSATEGLYAAAISLVASETLPFGGGQGGGTEAIKAPAETRVTLLQSERQADAEGRATFTVLLELPEGVHVNGPEVPARWLTPTRVSVKPLKAEIAYPPEDGEGYVGRVEIPFAVGLPKGESGADLEVVVAYQPCTETECLAPAEKILNAVIYR